MPNKPTNTKKTKAPKKKVTRKRNQRTEPSKPRAAAKANPNPNDPFHDLTSRHKTVAELHVAGIKHEAIAIRVGLKSRGSTASQVISRMLKGANISRYVDWLRSQDTQFALLTRKEKRLALAEAVARGKGEHKTPQDRTVMLQAIKIDNEMTGDNAPQKVEVSGSLLSQIRKNSKA